MIGLIHLSGASLNLFLEGVKVSCAIHLDTETELRGWILCELLDNFTIFCVRVFLSWKKVFIFLWKQASSLFGLLAFWIDTLTIVDRIKLFNTQFVCSLAGVFALVFLHRFLEKRFSWIGRFRFLSLKPHNFLKISKELFSEGSGFWLVKESLIYSLKNIKGLSILISKLSLLGFRKNFSQIGERVLFKTWIKNEQKVIENKAIVTLDQMLDHFSFW